MRDLHHSLFSCTVSIDSINSSYVILEIIKLFFGVYICDFQWNIKKKMKLLWVLIELLKEIKDYWRVT